MAGHPTIGTAFVLAQKHLIQKIEPETTLTFEEGVGIIPVTPELYPEKTVDNPKLLPADAMVAPYYRKFLLTLADHGVEVVDLLKIFQQERGRSPEPLTLRSDPHWSNRAAQVAAQAIGRRLERYGFVKDARHNADGFSVKESSIVFKGETIKLAKVFTPDGKPYEDAQASPLLVVGDSNMQIYDFGDPNMDWTPEGVNHAGFTAHLARATGTIPSLYAVQAFTPGMLNREPKEFWAGRKVVVFLADVRVIGWNPWPVVNLRK